MILSAERLLVILKTVLESHRFHRLCVRCKQWYVFRRWVIVACCHISTGWVSDQFGIWDIPFHRTVVLIDFGKNSFLVRLRSLEPTSFPFMVSWKNILNILQNRNRQQAASKASRSDSRCSTYIKVSFIECPCLTLHRSCLCLAGSFL